MTKAEIARIVAWRLRVLQHAENEPRQVAQTRRYFRISRTAFYRWKRRFDELGEAGLADWPRTPRTAHRSPRATAPAVMSKILYLRQNYHFGARRIAGYLQRFHQVAVARSTVHRILVKPEMGRLPANHKHRPHRKRWKRYYIRLRTPHLNGKVERSHRIDDQEFCQLIDQNGIFLDQCEPWAMNSGPTPMLLN